MAKPVLTAWISLIHLLSEPRADLSVVRIVNGESFRIGSFSGRRTKRRLSIGNFRALGVLVGFLVVLEGLWVFMRWGRSLAAAAAVAYVFVAVEAEAEEAGDGPRDSGGVGGGESWADAPLEEV